MLTSLVINFFRYFLSTMSPSLMLLLAACSALWYQTESGRPKIICYPFEKPLLENEKIKNEEIFQKQP